ncbi:MAG: class I SAM-dependent methyltransferase [Desulfobacterales bacterium]|nr:class I SAM-dependent methyltransferase [Desulfobacterales bacterium]
MSYLCPICSYPNIPIKQNFYDDRYGYPGQFETVCCQNCGHTSIPCDFSTKQLTDLYSTYYPRSSFDISQYKPHQKVKGLRSWFDGTKRSAFRWVPRNVRVLDIGCGFGESLGYHTMRGCEVYGVEADENIQRVADKFGYKVHVGLFDPELYEPAFFDYVTMDQVIEHVTDPLETLYGVSKVLKQGGTVILSTPNANGWGAKIFGRRWINWHPPYHLQFFSEKSMKIGAEKAGLEIKKTLTITSSEWLSYQWIHLVLFPKISEPSIFWSNKRPRTLWEKIWLAICRIIHKTKLNHLVTRFFDALGVGDNYLFFLEKK